MAQTARPFWLMTLLLLLLWAAPARAANPACEGLTKLVDQKTGPVFLASFPTVTSGPLSGVAFTYDNAVAAIALIACGETQKAARIGDALLAAQDHDRYWHDGRLRNGYLAGAASDAPLKLPGWWDDKQNMWVEDQYQAGSDTGNQAWAMLALLALYRAGAGPQYLSGAVRIGAYVEKAFDARGPGGFNGGAFGDEPAPAANTWKSTEHNTDLAAAFTQLAEATGEARWRDQARQASDFVGAMWNAAGTCFAVGTAEDGQTTNPYLALDAQIWPLLALPGYAAKFGAVLDTVQARLKDGAGFSYSEAKEGVWTEGTAQAALLFGLSGQGEKAAALLAAIEDNRAPDGSYYAASVTDLPTGFMLQTDPSQPRLYFHIAHLAALSWTALARERFNPFNSTHGLPPQPP
jgi:hypothetical protein